MQIARLRLFLRKSRQALLAHALPHGTQRQVGVDGGGAVSDQRRKVVYCGGFAAFQHDAHLRADAAAQGVGLYAADRQQGGNRSALLIHTPVAENEDVIAFFKPLVQLAADAVHGAAHPFLSLLRIIEDGQGQGAQAFGIQLPQLGKLAVRHQRGGQAQLAATLGRRGEQIALRAKVHERGGDDFLPDGVNGRVGHLGKELMEIGKERLRPVRQNGQRQVRAHGGERFRVLFGHGQNHVAHLLPRVAEGLLQLPKRRGIFGRSGCREVRKVHAQLGNPLVVRIERGHAALDLHVIQQAPRVGVHHQHAAGAQAVAAQHPFGGKIQRAGFGGHHQEAVGSDQVAGGTQAISVQHGQRPHTVGHGHGGGTIPRIHHVAVKFVERAKLAAHGLVLLPGLGNHHHGRMGQRASRQQQKFQRVVKHGAVAAIVIDDGEHLRKIGAEEVGMHMALAGIHALAVAMDGVDFTVVDGVAVGVRPFPAGEGIGGIAAVHQSDGRIIGQVVQIQIQLGDLTAEQHALVNDGATGQTGGVKVPRLGIRRVAQTLFGDLADEVELALKRFLVVNIRASFDERLADDRHAGTAGLAQRGCVDRDAAPAQKPLPLLTHNGLEGGFSGGAAAFLPAQKQHAHAISARGGQRNPHQMAFSFQKGVRQLGQDACAIARVRFRTCSAPVFQIA